MVCVCVYVCVCVCAYMCVPVCAYMCVCLWYLCVCCVCLWYVCVCYRDDPPSQSVTVATQELLRLSEENPEGLSGLDPVKDLHLRDIDLVEQFRSLQFMQQEFAQFQCVHCPKFEEHVSPPERERDRVCVCVCVCECV